MSIRLGVLVTVIASAAATIAVHAQTPPPAGAGQTGAPTTEAALGPAIDQLGAFDLAVRTRASQAVRRAPATIAVPMLAGAARTHKDEYVRYRALVLLTDFGEAPAAPVMRDLLGDRDNRVRLVAYGWFGLHPDPAVLPRLLSALDTEHSEFVRPALTRTVAAYGDDPRVRAALVPLVTRGEDLFRSAVIEALGDYHAKYAAAPIADVAKLDGPLQDDAVMALGKMGDASMLPQLSQLQQHGPDDLQPSIATAVCLITNNCAPQDEYLKKTLAFAGSREEDTTLLSRVGHALGALASANHAASLVTLFDAGIPAKDPARGVIAVAVGTVALRNPAAVLAALETRTDLSGAVMLLRDSFDMLSEEDYGQERFYAAVHEAMTTAPAGSKRRQVATAVISALEF
jgi:HEAT repeat protein